MTILLQTKMTMGCGLSDCGVTAVLITFMYDEVIIHHDDMSKVIEHNTLL